jgi:hypothetical protein
MRNSNRYTQFVIPTQAGIQLYEVLLLDPRLRGGDEILHARSWYSTRRMSV